jgi:uncharacterized RDD family membrane protein YckC
MQVAVHYEYGSPYAGFWRRVAAHLIDGIIQSIVAVPFVVVAFLANDSLVQAIKAEDADTLAALRVYFAGMGSLTVLVYYTIFESSALQATPGKLALGLKVTDLAGESIGMVRAAIRAWPVWIYGIFEFFNYFADSFGGDFIVALLTLVSCIAVAFTAQKQGLHDMLAGTLVVRRGATFILRDEYASAF